MSDFDDFDSLLRYGSVIRLARGLPEYPERLLNAFLDYIEAEE